MNRCIPEDWTEVPKYLFDFIAASIDNYRDGWVGVVFYIERGSGKKFGAIDDSGRYYLNLPKPEPRCIGEMGDQQFKGFVAKLANEYFGV
jgi:hypothetical protein